MARVTRATELPGPISAAEALWYDLNRRASFLEGFGHLVQVDGAWPELGARVQWEGPPGGRGRVSETVDAFGARVGQTTYVEDAQLRGTQVVAFVAAGGDLVRVTVSLAWTLKEPSPLKDWVLVRRSVGEALRRTLVRYRIERLADLDDERASATTAP